MAKQIYDVIVIGTGAGGGMAIKTLCEAGLKVCAINAGRRLDPEKDFRYHRMPWDMKFRGLDDPKRGESFGYMDNEYTKQAWDHEIPFTVARDQVDVAAVQGSGRQDEFLGTQLGAFRRHRFQGGLARWLRRRLADYA